MIVWTVRRHVCQHSLGDEATEVAAWSQFFDGTWIRGDVEHDQVGRTADLTSPGEYDRVRPSR